MLFYPFVSIVPLFHTGSISGRYKQTHRWTQMVCGNYRSEQKRDVCSRSIRWPSFGWMEIAWMTEGTPWVIGVMPEWAASRHAWSRMIGRLSGNRWVLRFARAAAPRNRRWNNPPGGMRVSEHTCAVETRERRRSRETDSEPPTNGREKEKRNSQVESGRPPLLAGRKRAASRRNMQTTL